MDPSKDSFGSFSAGGKVIASGDVGSGSGLGGASGGAGGLGGGISSGGASVGLGGASGGVIASGGLGGFSSATGEAITTSSVGSGKTNGALGGSGFGSNGAFGSGVGNPNGGPFSNLTNMNGGPFSNSPAGVASTGGVAKAGRFRAKHDDIILTPTPKARGKGPKKWMLAVAGVLLVVAVVVGVVAVVMSGRRGSGSNGAVTGYRLKYNQYANYILSGAVANNSINVGDVDAEYEIYNILNEKSGVDVVEYFDKALELWNSFYSDYQGTEMGQDVQYTVNQYVSVLGDTTRFLSMYSKASLLANEDVTSAFVSNGADAAKNIIKERYADFANAKDSGMAVDYGNYMISYYNNLVEKLVVYGNAGCLASGAIDYGCVSEVELPEDLSNTFRQITSTYSDGGMFVLGAATSLVRCCFIVEQGFDNPNLEGVDI